MFALSSFPVLPLARFLTPVLSFGGMLERVRNFKAGDLSW